MDHIRVYCASESVDSYMEDSMMETIGDFDFGDAFSCDM